jgi:hypothetical protein
MKYVIIRDDDINALTPVKYIEKLYRPFIDRNLTVTFALIPDVNLAARLPDGKPENFLPGNMTESNSYVPIAQHGELIDYLSSHPCLQLAQHGCHHDQHEFLIDDKDEIIRRLNLGLKCFEEAGLVRPKAFVAPQDKLSATAIQEISKRYTIISTGWFQRSRLPLIWWPRYMLSKWRHEDHWRKGNCFLLSHPTSSLTRLYRPEFVLEMIKKRISEHELTILNTHWWEFFPNWQPDQPFIDVLHSLADFFYQNKEVRLIGFDQLLDGSVQIIR